MNATYKIHPSIGIARVGDSDDYYVGPDAAGALPSEYSSAGTNIDAFRDQQSRLLKQGARFKVYRYDAANPDGLEIKAGEGGVRAIEWTVWVANKKSSWFQFEQQTGSGMGPYPADAKPDSGSNGYAFANDQGYEANNANPDENAPRNPLRHNVLLGTTQDPKTINDPARQPLILDPGPRTVAGPNQREEFTLDPARYYFLSDLEPFAITRLGAALTDADGNLVVLGGDGNSGTTAHDGTHVTIGNYANNEGWFDDIADGPVAARLHMDDGSVVEADATAWVVVAPPAYAPQILNQVTMYDNMYDVFVREFNANPRLYSNGAFNPDYAPSYPDEILPILKRPAIYQYVCNLPSRALSHHAELLTDDHKAFNERIFPYLRGRGEQSIEQSATNPAENQPGWMPFLAGDNPISNVTISKYLGLTRTQYFILSQYAKGTYSNDPLPPVGPGVAADIGNLENCVGGAFTPGIEITWITRNVSIYKPLPPGFDASDFFRINARSMGDLTPHQLSLDNGSDNDYTRGLEPGDLSKYMAQPWQADFNECSTQDINNTEPLNKPSADPAIYWWWPAQRPYAVYPKDSPQAQVMWTRGYVEDVGNGHDSDIQMVTCWKYLGFVVENDAPGQARQYVEVSRLTDKIDAYQPSRQALGATS